MTRVDITLGLLSILGAIAITAAVGMGEEERMSKASLGFQKRSVESGAQMFNQYCANCHGPNASGLNCPPLDETSGLHGGDIGAGIAWRLEEQHWDRNDAYGYVYSIIAAGRTQSTRPDRYRGTAPDAMQMPAWSQQYGGPLRPDQIKDLATYVVAFREYFPEAGSENAAVKACERVVGDLGTAGLPAPSVAGYQSACYETLCTAKIQAGDPEFVAPKEPTAPDPNDPKYADDAAQLAADQAQYAKDRAARDAYWQRCATLGGTLPPTPAAVPATSPAAEADAAAAEGTGTPGADEGTAGTDAADADAAQGGTGTPGAAAGGEPEATATP